MIGAGWRPTVDNYFRSVTKSRILVDVTDAKGSKFAQMIDHLKKGDMAREADRLMEDVQWLPEPLRTPGMADLLRSESAPAPLPPFLDQQEATAPENDGEAAGCVCEVQPVEARWPRATRGPRRLP